MTQNYQVTKVPIIVAHYRIDNLCSCYAVVMQCAQLLKLVDKQYAQAARYQVRGRVLSGNGDDELSFAMQFERGGVFDFWFQQTCPFPPLRYQRSLSYFSFDQRPESSSGLIVDLHADGKGTW
jgi:hypothetical protein